MATWVLGGLCLLPGQSGHRSERCDLLIEGGRIAAVQSTENGQTSRPLPADRVIDASNCLVVPGFVNAHTHSPDNLIKGSAPNLPLELWSLSSAAGREGRTPRETYVAALIGCMELLHTGTTTVLDHIRYNPYPTPEGLDAVARAYRDAGLRAVIAPVVADRAVVQTMPLDPADLPAPDPFAYGRSAAMPADEQIQLIDQFIARWHGTDGRILGAIGPSGPQRCSDRLMQMAGEVSARHGVIWHSHVLETKVQREMGYRLYGRSMVRHLDDLGLLNRRTNLVHLIWAEEPDLDLIASTGAAVVHNPVSNAKLGSGICSLPALLRRGIPVALGTDSACCNDSNNLLETAKWAALLHSLHSPDPEDWVGPEAALVLATAGGAGALGLGELTGAIRVGLAADLTLFSLSSPPLVPLNNPVRQLVQAESGAGVHMVIVGGEAVFANGRCSRIDEESLRAEAQELAERRLRANESIYRSAAGLTEAVTRMYRRIHTLPGR